MKANFTRACPMIAIVLAALIAVHVPAATAQRGVRIVRPIAAGIWFPSDHDELRDMLAGMYAEAEKNAAENPDAASGRLVACIVPHAPYTTSGPIAASALRLLEPYQYERVIILAGAHNSKFRGCSIPSAQAYVTPLGVVPIDCAVVREIDRLSPLIEVRSLKYGQVLERQQLHENETSIEVMLPYLQARLGTFAVVPIMVGEFKDHHGNIDVPAINAVVSVLKRYLDDKTLLVVSSDFTHFGNRFSYRPFRENILQGIEMLDRNAFDLILSKNSQGFHDYLTMTGNTICGKEAISIMLEMLPKNASGKLTGYEISARISGDTRSSISYAGIAFTVPNQAQARQ